MRFRAFLRNEQGAILIFVVMMLPLLLLCGGLAMDLSKLNAQRRYVQSQADLAAASAVRHLPDVARARQVAKSVVLANDRYGAITLSDQDLEFGSLALGGGFVAASDPHNPPTASALRVSVPSRFAPILLGPLIREERRRIIRRATAGQRAQVVFTLRNRLISLESRESLLNAVFGPLGLNLNMGILGYDGLSQSRVSLQELLGFLSLGLGAGALTFDDALDLPVTLPSLVSALVAQSVLPAGIGSPSAPAGTSVTLRQILALSPSTARLHLGEVLPDVTVNAFDLLAAFAGLAATPTNRVAVQGTFALAPLANVSLSLGIIRPPVIAMGDLGDPVKPRAEIAQTSLGVSATVLGLSNLAVLRLAAEISLADATSTIRSLNCAASLPNETLALFDSRTGVLSLGLNVSLLETQANIAPRDLTRRSLASRDQETRVTLAQLRRPVAIENPVSLTALVNDLDGFLSSARSQIQSRITASGCSPGLLGLLGCSLTTLLNATLMLLLNTLNTVLNSLVHLLDSVGAAKIVDALLEVSGLKLAQAELILDDYTCSAALVE